MQTGPLKTAMQQGRPAIGRKRLLHEEQLGIARQLFGDGVHAADIAARMRVSVSTLYRYLPAHQRNAGKGLAR
jgi:DNA invertase Pin-like site-specific DNA recombinase